MEEERNEEDRIVEALLIEGNKKLFEDLDFLPTRQSLYTSEKYIPDYDDEVFQQIMWKRPDEIHEKPVYFEPNNKEFRVLQGSLPDETFLGALMAVCVYSKYDLIENIFASRPEDFNKYGIYTCRFYVNGEWVEVITDTLLPCKMNNQTGVVTPVYGRSSLSNELWISLLEKAFAKAVGSYEAITTMKVQKALLHLTGGSIQQVNLREEVIRMDAMSDQMAWMDFKNRLKNDCIVLMMPEERKSTLNENGEVAGETTTLIEGANHSTDGGFIPNRLYSVILTRDIGGYELVLMHSPWYNQAYQWSGEWSDGSNDWDLYPEMLVEIEKDPTIPWRRKSPNGYFWIAFRSLIKHFNRMYTCFLFPNEKFNFYCVRGESRKDHAGGPLSTIRDKDIVLKEAAQSRSSSLLKASAAAVIDGDSSWFNNPQFRISCSSNTIIFASVIPLGNGEERDAENAQMSVSIVSSPKHSSSSLFVPVNIWDISQFEMVGSDKGDHGPVSVKGQETSIWNININPKSYYHIIPNTIKKGKDCDFILRVFSNKPIVLETLPYIPMTIVQGEWKRVGDLDTTGGPPTLPQGDGNRKDNPKWCQNPQYHLQLLDPYGKDDIYLKIVLRKNESTKVSSSSGNKSAHQSAQEEKKQNATVGFVVAKADVLDENPTKAKKKQPRQNKLGEPIPLKESSLKKKFIPDDEVENTTLTAPTTKLVLRKLQIEPSQYHLTTSYSNKTEACLFYPKLPRSWIPNGLLIVPSLSEKGIKGKFDLEIYCSEKININPLPETYSRSLAGDWTEATSGGSHINANSWKKNPKFSLRFHTPPSVSEPVRFRITLAKYGQEWRNLSKRDAVGCMIGFYIFLSNSHSNHHDQELVYESTFVPDEEFTTEASFALMPLHHDQVYTIMPATFSEGKFGSFVVSILSETEFHFTKDT